LIFEKTLFVGLYQRAPERVFPRIVEMYDKKLMTSVMLTPGLQYATGCGCDRNSHLPDGFPGRKVQAWFLEAKLCLIGIRNEMHLADFGTDLQVNEGAVTGS
jgi:hypothetical protein